MSDPADDRTGSTPPSSRWLPPEAADAPPDQSVVSPEPPAQPDLSGEHGHAEASPVTAEPAEATAGTAPPPAAGTDPAYWLTPEPGERGAAEPIAAADDPALSASLNIAPPPETAVPETASWSPAITPGQTRYEPPAGANLRGPDTTSGWAPWGEPAAKDEAPIVVPAPAPWAQHEAEYQAAVHPEADPTAASEPEIPVAGVSADAAAGPELSPDAHDDLVAPPVLHVVEPEPAAPTVADEPPALVEAKSPAVVEDESGDLVEASQSATPATMFESAPAGAAWSDPPAISDVGDDAVASDADAIDAPVSGEDATGVTPLDTPLLEPTPEPVQSESTPTSAESVPESTITPESDPTTPGSAAEQTSDTAASVIAEHPEYLVAGALLAGVLLAKIVSRVAE